MRAIALKDLNEGHKERALGEGKESKRSKFAVIMLTGESIKGSPRKKGKMKEFCFDLETIIIGAILLAMEIGYCIVRDVLEWVKGVTNGS